MAVVNETLDAPGGGSPNAVVTIRLVGEGGAPVRGFDASEQMIVGDLLPTVTAGAWTATLVANSAITPSGTAYQRVVRVDGREVASDFFEVPGSGGPYSVFDLLTEAPAAIASPALSTHEALRGPGGHLPNDGTRVPVYNGDGDVVGVVAYDAGEDAIMVWRGDAESSGADYDVPLLALYGSGDAALFAADGSFISGQASSGNWNVAAPLFLTGHDIEVGYQGAAGTEGVILRSPDETRWRITVGDDGELTTTEVV